MPGVGIGLSTRLGNGGGSGGSAELSASSGSFKAGLAAGTTIATLRDPFAGSGLGSTGYASFGTVPGQLALSGSAIVAGGSAATAGERYAIGVIATSGDGKRKRGETLLFTATAASTPVPTPTPTAAASPLLMTGRLVLPGFQGYTGSDGVDTDSNSRLSFYNETGASVTKLRACFPNWIATAINEGDAFNPITVSAAIEYPAGSFTPLAFGTAASASIANGALGESDEAVLATPIPADAQFWVRTFVSVPSGAKWPQGYQVRTSAGEAADFASNVDRTRGGTIANASPTTKRRGYGPAAIKATGFAGTARTVAYALVGDSTVMGSTDGSTDARGNTGYPARACSGIAPAINMGIAGTKAADNMAANFARRLNLIAKAGVTHVYCAYSQNDLAAGRSLATMQSNLSALWQMFADAGLKVVQATSLPRSGSGDGFVTVAGQAAVTSPAGAFDGGAGSKRAQLNAWIRTLPTPLYRCFDAADVVEPARDAGVWRAGDGSTYLTATGASTDAATTDGIHPGVTAASRGGVYLVRDAMAAALTAW